MAKKTDTTEKIEREYIIPIREKTRTVPRYKKAKKAIRIIKEFLVRHMAIRDRDLKKVRVDRYLNEYIWAQGIRSPPHKVKVKATKTGDIVRVELAEYPTNLKFKKAREERVRDKAREAVEKKKTLMERAKESLKPGTKEEVQTEDGKHEVSHSSIKDEREKKEETAEKEQTSAQATEAMEKETAKKEKHTTDMAPKIVEKSREKKVYNKSSRGH